MSATKPAAGEPASDGYAGSYRQRFRDVWNIRETILIVCDGSVSPRERIWDFTLTEVIASIEASHWFKFVVATRNGEFKEIRVPLPISPQVSALGSGPVPPVPDPDYEGFRFDRPEVLARLNGFGQIWLMGSLAAGESNNPLSEAELAILVAWMNRGGGVLAAGDHEEMGAAIASRIPRVNSMRRWLFEHDVPDQYGPDRLETTRPGTLAEALGTRVSFEAERDLVAQQIEWVPEYVGPAHSTPHPLLCHPRLGPIDVLPDHMHEGRCYDPQSATWQHDFLASQYSFGPVAGDVYPPALAPGGSRPLPRVVAWGNTLAAPPLNFGDPQNARRFPLIVAYDGRPADVGRVVTDSTWHHWFDYNLEGFAENRGHEASRKIYRYWLNVALWLSRSTRITGLVLSEIKDNEFKFFGRQMVDLKASSYQVGRATISWLGASLSPCIVRGFADGLATELLAGSMPPKDDGLRSPCEPPLEKVQAVIMGEIVKELFADQQNVMREIAARGSAAPPSEIDDALSVARRAAKRAVAGILADWNRDLAEGKALFERLRDRLEGDEKAV